MLRLLRRDLSTEKLKKQVADVLACAERQDLDAGWASAAPLIAAAPRQREAAAALLGLLASGAFTRDRGRELTAMLFEAYADDPEIAAELGHGLGALYEVEFLNNAPPQEPIFTLLAQRLAEHAQATLEPEVECAVLGGLSTAARVLGRTWDATAERAYRRLLNLDPERWQNHYGIGLFFKTRGRFAEGLAANQRAAELGGAANEAVQWNLGICATGAGAAEAALQVWKALGQKIEMGRFDLPEGGYGSVKVRLAERPLAMRDPELVPNDPGAEETIWIERLSPCHGIVRSALYQDLGLDYGDVVLFDGAPITRHTYGDTSIPVFPHLATLVHNEYRIYEFAGTQINKEEIAGLSAALPADAVAYVHSEQVTWLCSSCWADRATDHTSHATSEHHVVTGKLCFPPAQAPIDIQRTLDAIVAANPNVRLYVPQLAHAAGDPERAQVEQRRFAMIKGER